MVFRLKIGEVVSLSRGTFSGGLGLVLGWGWHGKEAQGLAGGAACRVEECYMTSLKLTAWLGPEN